MNEALSVATRPPTLSSIVPATAISVTTASHPDPDPCDTNNSVLRMKRPRNSSDLRGVVGAGDENLDGPKSVKRLAAVPLHEISKRPSIGLAPNFLFATSGGSGDNHTCADSNSGTINREAKIQVAVPNYYLSSTFSKASAASVQAHAANGERRLHHVKSASELPRNTSTQSLPSSCDGQGAEQGANAPTLVEKGVCNNAGTAAAKSAKLVTREMVGQPPSGFKERPVMSKSVSLPSIMSPQLYLDSIFKSRGHCTQNYCSLEGGYYCKPTPHQKASYGIRLVHAVRTSDSNLLSSLLECGLSRNPCNTFGESIIHMVCRRADYGLLKVLVDAGCSLQVSDDFGRTPLHDACWTATPNFDVVDLILRTDPRLLRIVDCRGSSPLSYIKRSNWDKWVEYIDARKDEYWPVRDLSKDGVQGPPPLVGAAPHSRPVQDPKDAASLEMAEKLASGQLDPKEALRKKEEMAKNLESGQDDSVTAAHIKFTAAPIAAA